MLINANILPIIIAGLINGSFVIPSRFIKNTPHAKIWFYYTIISLLIIPWALLYLISPSLLHNYAVIDKTPLLFLIFSGLIFGAGQLCFVYAIELIGVALSFTINLGIGVTIGSLFVIFYRDQFFTPQGALATLSVFLIVAALIIHYYAGRNSHKNAVTTSTNHYHMGWSLAAFAGVASGLQNIAFIILAFHSNSQIQSSNSYWVWPLFLSVAAIPMLIGFWLKAKNKNEAGPSYFSVFVSIKNIFLLILMGLFFTGSLALYSKGMNQLSHHQQVLGWPTLMVCIILTSQAWGLFFGEMKNHSKKDKACNLLSIALLIISIILLAAKI